MNHFVVSLAFAGILGATAMGVRGNPGFTGGRSFAKLSARQSESEPHAARVKPPTGIDDGAATVPFHSSSGPLIGIGPEPDDGDLDPALEWGGYITLHFVPAARQEASRDPLSGLERILALTPAQLDLLNDLRERQGLELRLMDERYEALVGSMLDPDQARQFDEARRAMGQPGK